MNKAFIGLGSNLDNPSQHILDALTAISQLDKCNLVAVSNTYRSIAVGPGEQPDYINAACLIETNLTTLELLDQLQAIELQHGRVRDIRWGARTLDLDIIMFDNIVCDTERLILPHPRAIERDFVLRPLLDIEKTVQFPNGDKAFELLSKADGNGLISINSSEEIMKQLNLSKE